MSTQVLSQVRDRRQTACLPFRTWADPGICPGTPIECEGAGNDVFLGENPNESDALLRLSFLKVPNDLFFFRLI
jgi:hypothetical protein